MTIFRCGAHDGEFYSNSLPLEMSQGWSGLLVEADPLPLQKLQLRNRRSWIAPVCLSPEPFPLKVHINKKRISSLKIHKGITRF